MLLFVAFVSILKEINNKTYKNRVRFGKENLGGYVSVTESKILSGVDKSQGVNKKWKYVDNPFKKDETWTTPSMVNAFSLFYYNILPDILTFITEAENWEESVIALNF